ncbi:uncharacterized protein BDR25DRAFT_387606 [Lindgomyces ingoldianus]|uniref:Uncharacterized protein n=1 Tax=Lindgomyces ingoldianus TaxID=673940 RepID=A0ACB6R2M4_9PLEO|nr:uncharacterized protein BDR25DRAFT_387606 [Lindgomyces ingoldianus]KAF2473396.1 hypothetical protein BDR25DRAFT_387606 [Lindgomyces ingoldianus]
MRLTIFILFAVKLSSVLALPNQRLVQRFDIAAALEKLNEIEGATLLANQARKGGKEASNATAKATPPAAAESATGGAAVEGDGKEGEGENEVRIEGKFDTPTTLQGAIGAFEYEFQAPTGDELTVTENKTPPPPPAGFVAVEPSSFKVALKQSKGAGLTLSKIDYIFDPTSPALTNVDLAQTRVGKLCNVTGTFVVDESLGELEFEAEENEATLNLNKQVTAEGEWGIFLPVGTVAAAFSKSVQPVNATVKV